ncbi:hypothetical protein IC617_08975 [Neiella sp. HB171785]|uniref:Uncharacterized protein n=1 Tax=Neiella litorisoli TaxID=2771431 RepID=A0A8J6R2V8_9GAMM|nr:hypothetical protein [Neiella litorisoli]MBD1389560.1 hypothetical protein [Neiella litorisoli]
MILKRCIVVVMYMVAGHLLLSGNGFWLFGLAVGAIASVMFDKWFCKSLHGEQLVLFGRMLELNRLWRKSRRHNWQNKQIMQLATMTDQLCQCLEPDDRPVIWDSMNHSVDEMVKKYWELASRHSP